MLTRREFSFDRKKEIFYSIVSRYQIPNPDIQNILNEALEIAVALWPIVARQEAPPPLIFEFNNSYSKLA